MKNKTLLKKFFKTTALESISLSDINNQLGQLQFMRRRKMITTKEFEEYTAFLEALQDDKYEQENESKHEKARKLRKAQEFNVRAQARTVAEFNRIAVESTVATVHYKKGSTYLVTYNCKALYPSGNHVTIHVSQTIEAAGDENDNHMIRKAFLLWTQLHYHANSPPELIWPSIKFKRIIANGVGTDLSHIGMGSLVMMYKSFQDLPEEFKSGKQI